MDWVKVWTGIVGLMTGIGLLLAISKGDVPAAYVLPVVLLLINSALLIESNLE